MTLFKEYFSLLGILPAFDLDIKALEAGYFQAQRKNHPDRFVGASDEERIAALQRSADINMAYDNLKDPLTRAQYLLLLQDIVVGTEKDSVKPSQELLAEILELRESVDDARDIQKLYALSDELTEIHEKLLNYIDASYTKGQWDKMAQQTLRLGYVRKTIEDVQKKKARLQKK